MSIANPQSVVDRLKEFQRAVRERIIRSRSEPDLHEVDHETAEDTIFRLDTKVDPILLEFCREWAKSTPLVLVAEGLKDAGNQPAAQRVFPDGARDEDAPLRLIVDPIDGTRGLMYDKRPAWALAA